MHDAVATPGMVVAGRYRLEAEIGQGGFSRVFRAIDLRLGSAVALKLLSRDSVDAAGEQRFRREAELGRLLVHPNTVRLLDFDPEASPAPFIAYELLEGERLDHVLRAAGPLPDERVVGFTRQVLKSLMEAHAAGVIHRDMKPANIFVCNYAGEPEFLKVLDFGIAKSASSEQLTAAGMVIGTPRYMAPEQIRGATPTAAMDLYAVGMMMGEMLHGAPLVGGTPTEAALAQMSSEPVALPAAVRRSRLGKVVAKAVDKDPARRYSEAATMLREMEAALLAPAPVFTEEAPFAEPEPDVPSSQQATLLMADVLEPSAAAPTSGEVTTVLAPLQPPRFDPPPIRSAPPVAVPAPRRPRVLLALAGFAGGVCVVAGAVLLWLTRADSLPPARPGPTREQVVEAAPSARPTASAVASAAPKPTVRLSIATEPAGAVVRRSGVEVCATTPCQIEVTAFDAVELEARKGTRRGSAKVLAQHSQSVKIELLGDGK